MTILDCEGFWNVENFSCYGSNNDGSPRSESVQNEKGRNVDNESNTYIFWNETRRFQRKLKAAEKDLFKYHDLLKYFRNIKGYTLRNFLNFHVNIDFSFVHFLVGL